MSDQVPSIDPIAPLRVALKGRYEIQREIGQGAFATVYLARDSRHERSVALKVLNADPTSETGEIRFIREIRLLAGLQHPNILPLHDSGHVEALLYYVMPYVSGETLRARMSRERWLSIDVAVCVARESADALACAHGQGIIHRDIKPENILLSGGHAIVADFGIARAIDIAGVRQLTRTGMGGPGTPAYMSPEQLMGDHPLDGRSDIYSLGCVLYEMLTGKPPFAGKEGFVKRFTESAPLASSIRKEVDPWLDTAVATALSRDPDDRYATAGELVRALSAPTSGEPAVRGERGSRQHSSPMAERLAYSPPAATSRVAREVQQASIGVLPFTNMSADPENEYFSDGITEEILNALTRIPALKVAARSSSFALKGKLLDIREIGERLKVTTVLEGSVRRVNQRVRITAQLINAADGYHIWSERYDRDIEDVFAIQDEIARTIVNRLKVKLGTAEYEALGKGQTENLEAYELYLRGRHCWNRWHLWGMMEKAMGYYEAALAKDPDYALAHHGLADAYATIGLYAFAPGTEVIPKARAAAFRAVELAPELAEAWTSLGFVHMLSWDWKEAESTLLRSIDINPRYPSARTLHSWLLTILGRHSEAQDAAQCGHDLDPLSSRGGIPALVLYHGRQYDEAIAECERGLELDPTSFLSLLVLSLSHAGKGEYDQAVQHAERGVTMSPGSDFLRALLGAVYAMAGREEAARGILTDLVERSGRSYVAPILVSWIYSNLQDRDSAFEWLDKAYDERTCTLGSGIGYAVYDGIREDPRFGELLHKLGLN